MLKSRINRGDTIVEVMVVLAVLGLAISLSYATANRSLLNARQAQENGRATALAQSQLEQIRQNAPITDSSNQGYVYRAGNFCISRDDPTKRVDIPADPSQFPDACHEAGNDKLYNITDSWSGNPPGGGPSLDTFTVVVTWDDVLGNGQDSVTLSYRVHPQS